VRLRRADPHTLAGAYALDSLSGQDRAAFERHLDACDACRQEAASLRDAAARLGTATAAVPPPGLREKVLRQAAVTRQHPPPVVGAPAGQPGWHLLARPVRPRIAAALAGFCMLAALGLGGMFLHSQHRLNQVQDSGAAVSAVLTAPDAHMMTTRAVTGGSATVVMSGARHALVITTARLPVLPASQRYEVWLMGPRGDRSAGMLPVPHHGMTAPMVVSGLAAGDRVGVTVEPAAGSRHPSATPVISLGLSS
jgi:anti-sigma-K factor RskA